MSHSSAFRLMNRFVNPVTRLLLRSPLGGLLGRSTAIIRIRGTRSGRIYQLPVQYVRKGERVVIVPGQPEKKTWWRNLRRESRVTLRLAGKEYAGTARALRGSDDPERLVELLTVYLEKFKKARNSLALPPDWADSPPASTVVVEVDLSGEESA